MDLASDLQLSQPPEDGKEIDSAYMGMFRKKTPSIKSLYWGCYANVFMDVFFSNCLCVANKF